jgi:hypothetical protein
MASTEEEEEEQKEEEDSLDQLPGTVLATIISKLDVASICSVASTCKTFNACASHILTFIPSFHLLVSQSLRHEKPTKDLIFFMII